MDTSETPAERPPLVQRKLAGQWSWCESIKTAIRNVRGASEPAEYQMSPMVWGTRRGYGNPSVGQDPNVRQQWPAQFWQTRQATKYTYDADTRYARRWWLDMTTNRDMHPAVAAVIKDDWVPDYPGGLGRIVLEYPSVSSDMRLAYVQTEEKGRADRWTVTAPGKYIKSRWSYLTDHYIRDVVARTAMAAPQIWHKPQDIVRAVQHGPSSCMQWGEEDIGDRISDDWDESDEDPGDFWVRKWEYHPCSVYTPRFGWRMAVRMEGPQIMARALVLHHSGGPYTEGETLEGSVFVRSYRRTEGYSPADEALESWLQHMGVEKRSEWPLGTRFARVENPQKRYNELMMPYIDGAEQCVADCGQYVRLTSHGMQCNNTDGTCGDDNTRTCDCCDEQADSDEGIHVGYHGDSWVGDCCSGDYTLVLGRRRSEYYVPNDDAVQVGDTYYDREYLSDNSIVELDNGDYVHEDDAFCCPIDNRWYHVGNGQDTSDEGYVHCTNAWQCYGSDEWYSTNTDWVTVDGEKYHPDHAPDDEEAEPGSTFDPPYQKPEGSIANEAQLPLPSAAQAPQAAPEQRKYWARGVLFYTTGPGGPNERAKMWLGGSRVWDRSAFTNGDLLDPDSFTLLDARPDHVTPYTETELETA